ncbi:hypothetical protein J2X31_002253 [Flavobacterium arsenatis]|uniref:Lipoprotein n=1 Tax=Flavobacterium arsenatis TaxID=1484332 RepID=A0ABU1TQI8_9FLAO|nr:hypothetical protein [Flavobacterium arsenatis]MDR6968236.1 hypothetical protein [Flavobacterium arsenatis]
MKKIILIFAVILTFFGCEKNDDNNNETLPPATQTGAGTFACYVNGKAFIDKSGGYFNCFYQLVNGEYYFGISGLDDNHSIFRAVALATNASEITNDQQYELSCNEPNNHYGEVAFTRQLLDATTCNSSFGTMTITKLDFDNNIVSGTFEFDVIHPNSGEIIQIRDGRFDTLFTQ